MKESSHAVIYGGRDTVISPLFSSMSTGLSSVDTCLSLMYRIAFSPQGIDNIRQPILRHDVLHGRRPAAGFQHELVLGLLGIATCDIDVPAGI